MDVKKNFLNKKISIKYLIIILYFGLFTLFLAGRLSMLLWEELDLVI